MEFEPKQVERFRLRRVPQGFVIDPVERGTPPRAGLPAVPTVPALAGAAQGNPGPRVSTGSAGPLLLALFDNDEALVRAVIPDVRGQLTWVVGELMVRASQRGLELEPKGRLQDPVLHLSRRPTPRAVPGVAQPFSALPGRYAAHWGITDFYPEHLAALIAVLESGEAFDTGEFGAKKEIEFARVRRRVPGGAVELQVRCEADDGVALADTAFWKAAGGNAVCDSGEDALRQRGLDDEAIDQEMRSLAEAAGIGEVNETRAHRELEASTASQRAGPLGIERVLDSLANMVELANKALEQRYAAMQALAQARLAELSSRRGWWC